MFPVVSILSKIELISPNRNTKKVIPFPNSVSSLELNLELNLELSFELSLELGLDLSPELSFTLMTHAYNSVTSLQLSRKLGTQSLQPPACTSVTLRIMDLACKPVTDTPPRRDYATQLHPSNRIESAGHIPSTRYVVCHSRCNGQR